MGSRRWLFIVTPLIVLLFYGVSFAQESGFAKEFIKALDANDEKRMTLLVEMKKATVPDEVKALIDASSAKEVTHDERMSMLYVAEVMAQHYKEVTGDFEPLKEVKKATFNAQIPGPVRSTATKGIHVVTMPMRSEKAKNYFKPANIIIKKGETVKWVNEDSVAHIFSSMPFIGAGVFLSPMIDAGGDWQYTFDVPGEYFYICFIHAGMLGKITVEE